MGDPFRKRRPGLETAAQLRNLLLGQGPGRELFQGAKSDAIGLTQSAVDGAGFGHTHLGVVEDEGRDIARMRVAIADEAAAFGGLVDGGFENPEVFLGATQADDWIDVDPSTTLLSR
jgi:hypothetical protein